MTVSHLTITSSLYPTVPRVVRRWQKVERTLLTVVVLSCAWGNAGLLPAQTHVDPSQTHVIIGAGVAEEPRSGNQFEFAIAAATGLGIESAHEGVIHVAFCDGRAVSLNQFNQSDLEFLTARVHRIDFFTEEGIPVGADVYCTAEVMLRNGRRFRRVPIRLTPIISEPVVVGVELDLGRSGVVAIEGSVFSGGSSIEAFEPDSLVVSLGGGSTVESEFQLAAAIGAEGARGRLSLLANPDNGNLVRVDGLVDFAAVGDLSSGRAAASGLPTGKRQHKPLTVFMSGMAAVDMVRPDGSSPDTCFGDFTFVAHEGPHGPFRIDIPDCRDPAAGIEGTDVGSAAILVSETSWPPVERDRRRSTR